MKAFVFTDAGLERQAGRFVWLAIDTENERNAGLDTKLVIEGVPSLFVVDPRTDTVLRRWLGSATVAQLVGFLDEGREAWASGGTTAGTSAASPAPGSGVLDPAAAEVAFGRAELLFGKGDDGGAAPLYAEALAKAPAGWAHYARAADAWVSSLSGSQQPESCVAAARQVLPHLDGNPARASVTGSALDCALAQKPGTPARRETIAAFEALAHEVLADSGLAVAADDRSGLFGSLVDAAKDAGDDKRARQVAGEWAAFLEGEAARARSPEERTVFDSHRLSAYIAMGEPQRAIPMLTASQRDFPGDYNPPARLALAYKELGRDDEALAAIDRALKLAYGPRKVRLWLTRSEIDAARGDRAAARRDLTDALAFVKTLPGGARRDGLRKTLEDRLGRTPSG